LAHKCRLESYLRDYEPAKLTGFRGAV